MTVAKNRAIDILRRGRLFQSRLDAIAAEQALGEFESEVDDPAAIPDDRLRLIFTCCHPELARENRVALTLRLVGGLSTAEIARAFLVPEPTMAQRIVRAKRTIRERPIAYSVPERAEMAERLASVLSVLYPIFNEGYASASGQSLTRVDLCNEAIRLAGILAQMLPDEPEALGLLALMELQASRNSARVGPDGELVLMADQDRARWDRVLIARGFDHLERASRLPYPVGMYQLQAAIAACHAVKRIASLYADLYAVAPSPVIELNRAIAVSMVDGPAAALPIIDAMADDPVFRQYHLFAATRGDFLRRLQRWAEAPQEYRRAMSLASNAPERDFLKARLAECEAH